MLAEVREVIDYDNKTTVTIDLNTDKKGSEKLVNLIKDLCNQINKPIEITPHDMEVKNIVMN